MKATPALDARKGRILAAIIQEYIHSAEPVASEVVVRRSGVEVSSATVRHEMAVLEEMGFLSQPHTPAAPLPPPALRAVGCARRAGRDCHRCRSLRRPAGRTARVG